MSDEPAFPVSGTAYYGMTLRDWFAGLAMQGMMSRTTYLTLHHVAREAYLAADVMLKQREVVHE